MSHIIAVHSFGRAAGRSTLTANLAVLLSQAGFRIGVLDTDFHAPSLHIFFGLPESEINCTLNTFLKGACAVEEAVYDMTERVGISPPGCLLIVPASTSVGEIIQFLNDPHEVDAVSVAIQRLEDSFHLDYLLLDTTPGLTEDTMLAVALADTVLVIVSPDAYDYQGAAVSIDVAHKLQVPRLLIVMNNAPDNLDLVQAEQELVECYDCEVGGILPYSESVLALASARLAALELPVDPFTERLRHLAVQLVQGTQIK